MKLMGYSLKSFLFRIKEVNMDGIIVINKEKGYTSHDVVAKLKKKLNISKVGHTGTLDPNATGVLPILIGKGTKFSKYLINNFDVLFFFSSVFKMCVSQFISTIFTALKEAHNHDMMHVCVHVI